MAFSTSKQAMCYILVLCAILFATAHADFEWRYTWTTSAGGPFYANDATSNTPNMCDLDLCATDTTTPSYDVTGITTVCYDTVENLVADPADCKSATTLDPVSEVTCNCSPNYEWKYSVKNALSDAQPSSAELCDYNTCPTDPTPETVTVVCVNTRDTTADATGLCDPDTEPSITPVTCSCFQWVCEDATTSEFTAAACGDSTNYECDVETTCPTPRDQLEIQKKCQTHNNVDTDANDCAPFVPVDLQCACTPPTAQWEYTFTIGSQPTFTTTAPTAADVCDYSVCLTSPTGSAAPVTVVCRLNGLTVDETECSDNKLDDVAPTCDACTFSFVCEDATTSEFTAAACEDSANYECDVETTCPTQRTQKEIAHKCVLDVDETIVDSDKTKCGEFTPVDLQCQCTPDTTARWEFKYTIDAEEKYSPTAPDTADVCDYNECLVDKTDAPAAAVIVVCRVSGATVDDEQCEGLAPLTLPVCDACTFSYVCQDAASLEFSAAACEDEANYDCNSTADCSPNGEPNWEPKNKQCIVNGNVSIIAADEACPAFKPIETMTSCTCVQFKWQYQYILDGNSEVSTQQPPAQDVCSYISCVTDASVTPIPSITVVCWDNTKAVAATDETSCNGLKPTVTIACDACGAPNWVCLDVDGQYSEDACQDKANYVCDTSSCSTAEPTPAWTLSEKCIFHTDLNAVSTECSAFSPVVEAEGDCTCPPQYSWIYKYTVGTEEHFSATAPLALDVCPYAQCPTATVEEPVTPATVEVVCRNANADATDEDCAEVGNKPEYTAPTCECVWVWACSNAENTFSVEACTDASNFECTATTCPDVSTPVPKSKICIIEADNTVKSEDGQECPDFTTDFTPEELECQCAASIYEWKFSYGDDIVSDDEPAATDVCSYKACLTHKDVPPAPSVDVVCYNTEIEEIEADASKCSTDSKPTITIECNECVAAWACPTETGGLSAAACTDANNYECLDEHCTIGQPASYIFPHYCVFNNDASAIREHGDFCGDFIPPTAPSDKCECDAMWYFKAVNDAGVPTFIPEKSYVDSASCDYTPCLEDPEGTPAAKTITVVCFKPTAESIADPTKGLQDEAECSAAKPSIPDAGSCDACALEWVCAGEFNEFTADNCAEKTTDDYECDRSACSTEGTAQWTLGEKCTYNGDLNAISDKCVAFTQTPEKPVDQTCTCSPTHCEVLIERCGENGLPNSSCSKCLCKAGFSGPQCQYSKNVAVGITFGAAPNNFAEIQDAWENELIDAVADLMVIPSDLISIPEAAPNTPSDPFVVLAVTTNSDNSVSVGMTISTEGGVSEADITSKWTQNVTTEALNKYPFAQTLGNATKVTGICAGIECNSNDFSPSEDYGKKSGRMPGYNIATIVIVVALSVIAIIAIISVVCVQTGKKPQQKNQANASKQNGVDNPLNDPTLELQ